MAGIPLRLVNESLSKAVKSYSKLSHPNIKITLVPFESDVSNPGTYITEEEALEAIKKVVSSGGTNFAPPLDYIANLLRQQQSSKNLLIFFLTDGENFDKAQAKKSADALQAILVEKNIRSKFCVIGVGEHFDVPFLDSLTTKGSSVGKVI